MIKRMGFVLGMVLPLLPLSGELSARETNKELADRPHIVVGMVVDQMCWDYLYRYQQNYGEGGFRRLLKDGFNCQNTRINYIPSVTAIGHTTVYTGSVPSIHGIAGNDFYDRGKPLYCTADSTVATVGASDGKQGRMSPRNLKVTTIADELKLATNFRSKVVGVALKDRGAILPAGHSADAAYWFDDKSGGFITSTYYMSELPRWVVSFNKKRLHEKYLSEGWKPALDRRDYTQSSPDANNFEAEWSKDYPATLPLNTKKLSKEQGAGVIRGVAMGNTFTLDMAMAAIEGEKLGARKDETDFLAVSLSSTDYVGHRYGTFALETEDTYVRLDRDLARFFAYLDEKFGRDGYLFFITADHAAAHNITFLQEHRLPGRAFKTKEALVVADSVAQAVAGVQEKLVVSLMNYQVFFDQDKLDRLGVDRSKLYRAVARELERHDGVAYAVVADEVSSASLPEEIRMRIINGYNHKRSGSIFVVLHPGWYGNTSDEPKGTTHSVWAPYDTHIPLIFMGRGVKAGKLYREVYMTDIAPTLAFLLKTQLPSGAIGKPITELLSPDSAE